MEHGNNFLILLDTRCAEPSMLFVGLRLVVLVVNYNIAFEIVDYCLREMVGSSGVDRIARLDGPAGEWCVERLLYLDKDLRAVLHLVVPADGGHHAGQVHLSHRLTHTNLN